VSIESAKYGEFLGIVEGADHWDTRGAQGFGRVWERDQGGWSQFFGWRGEVAKAQAPRESEKNAALKLMDYGEISTGHQSVPQASTQKERDQAKLAAALEWIAEKVPTHANVSALSSVQSSLSSSASSSSSSPPSSQDKSPAESPNQVPKFDLERFYIALARNLYEEGL
jgi:triacylglycerol lipase